MPDYAFSKVGGPKRVVLRFYHMSEVPSIGSIIMDPDGTQWKRLATKPRASFDTKIDCFSSADFVRTTNKKGTMGDLWDRSTEMSEKRKEKTGEVDPVKCRYYDSYAQKRKGKRHPQEMREEGSKFLKKKGISINWGDD